MNRHFIVLSFFLVSSFLTACQVAKAPSSDEEGGGDASSAVELSGEEDLSAPLLVTAQFLAEEESYSYSLEYDANLLSLTDQRFDGATENGASFKVKGNAEIVTFTAVEADLAFASELKDGQYSTVEESCSVEYRVVPNQFSATVLRLKACEGQDKVKGMAALSALQNSVQVQNL